MRHGQKLHLPVTGESGAKCEMKILFLTLNAFSKFPSYKRAVGTGEGLSLLGHTVIIVAFDCEENRDRILKEAPHCKVCWFKGSIASEIFQKIGIIWRERPDVVFSPSYSLHNLALLRVLLPWKTKFVLEFCELYSMYPTRRCNWAVWELFGVLECRYIVCASKYLENHFYEVCRKWHLSRSIEYAPYAYPIYLEPTIGRTDSACHKILFMGALYRVYGVFEVLSAFELLRSKRNDVELEILGGGPEKENVLMLINQRGLSSVVHLRGFVPEAELNRYFSSASVFISPMHDTIQDRARCPSKLFYYLPYNKPIVTCRIGNPSDVLGPWGFYYEPLDTESMEEAMHKAVSTSVSFSYPDGLIKAHSWMARARQMEAWLK